MSTATGSSRVSRGKGKETDRSRAPSPGADERTLEDMDPAEEQPVQPDDSAASGKRRKAAKNVAAAGDEEEEVSESAKEFIMKMRDATSRLYKEQGSMPSAADVAAELGCDDKKVESTRHALKMQRQGAKLSGLRRSALKAGYSRREDASRAEIKGLDIAQSLITPGDIQRLERAIPLNFDKGSYEPEEIEMRMELIHQTLPIGSAREVIGFVEPIFRSVITECVERQARTKTQRVTPSTMYSVLKKYADLGVFTSMVPPKGLVRHGKETGVGTYIPGKDMEPVELMESTTEDKKDWKKWKKECAEATAEFTSSMEAESARKAARKRKEAEEEEAVAAPAPKKKKTRATA